MKLTEINLNVHKNDRYPYKYRLEMPKTSKVDEWQKVKLWLEENNIPATVGPGFCYFKTKEDAVLTSLRWS
jgi:hypothetical protein